MHLAIIDREPDVALGEALRQAGFLISYAQDLHVKADAYILNDAHSESARLAAMLSKEERPFAWLGSGPHDVVHNPPTQEDLRLLHWMSKAGRGKEGHLSELGRVVTQVVHEIRNPLTALSAKLQWMRRKTEHDATVSKMSSTLLDEVERLSRMLSEVLEFGRARTQNRRAVTDVEQTLREVVALYRETAEAAQVTVELKAATAQVPYQSEELHQVFQNLLINAIDATPPDQTIRIHTSRTGVQLEVEFRNPGHLKEDTIDQIFDLFFTTKRNATGLGLPIVKRMVRGAQGDIIAMNDGADVVFRLTLPLTAGS